MREQHHPLMMEAKVGVGVGGAAGAGWRVSALFDGGVEEGEGILCGVMESIDRACCV